MSETPRRDFLRRGLETAAAGALTLGPGRIDARAAATAGGRPPNAPDWAALREEFLVAPGHAYLNTATLGSPPRAALDALARGYRELAADPETRRTEFYGRVEQSVRPLLARLLGADPAEIALTTSASESLYLAAEGIPLEPWDEVLYTNLDHPAGIEPWKIRARDGGIAVREVALPSPFTSGRQVIDRITAALTPRTRVLSFCHVTRGGHLFPAKELCALARGRGIVSLIDGAQALGMMQVDLDDLGCDLYAASPHKWLLAPSGNGLLYVRRGMQERLRSLYAGPWKPGADARRYEPIGTYALPVRAAMGPALELFERVGLAAIEARNRELSEYLRAGLDGIPRVRRVSPSSREVTSAGITLFEIPGVKPEDFQARVLRRHRLHVDEHARNGLQAVRVSTHFYNARAELDRLLEAVKAETRSS
jgi:isopenicillin-N epimerase